MRPLCQTIKHDSPKVPIVGCQFITSLGGNAFYQLHYRPISFKAMSVKVPTSGVTSINDTRDHSMRRQQQTHHNSQTINQHAEDIMNIEEPGFHDSAINVSETTEIKLDSELRTMSIDGTHLPYSRKPIRTLGGLEHMYSMYTNDGSEVISLMHTVESTYRITDDIAHTAWLYLLRRHPLLRANITKDQESKVGELAFCENNPLLYDFCASDRTDWMDYLHEEAAKPYSESDRPLFRVRLLRSRRIDKDLDEHNPDVRYLSTTSSTSPRLKQEPHKYRTTVLYTAHHSIIDGGYIFWIFCEHVNFIDAIATGMPLGTIKELPVLAPIESLMVLPKQLQTFSGHTVTDKAPGFSLCLHPDATTCTILEDYKKKFAEEISVLSKNKPSNTCISFRLCSQLTRQFIQRCKQRKCSARSGLYGASMFAFVDLVYGDSAIDDIEIPNEFMLDLRKCKFALRPSAAAPQYPGLASVHIPLAARLNRRDSSPNSTEFWQFVEVAEVHLNPSKLLEGGIPDLINETVAYKDESKRTLIPGKSAYPLCYSNLGLCDGAINEDVGKRVRLVGLHGHSTVLNDEMPVLFLTVLLLNGELCGSLSYCKAYTSYNTANNYITLFQKYLTGVSKL